MIERISIPSNPVRVIASVSINQLTLGSIANAYESGANIHGFCRNRQPGLAIYG